MGNLELFNVKGCSWHTLYLRRRKVGRNHSTLLIVPNTMEKLLLLLCINVVFLNEVCLPPCKALSWFKGKIIEMSFNVKNWLHWFACKIFDFLVQSIFKKLKKTFWIMSGLRQIFTFSTYRRTSSAKWPLFWLLPHICVKGRKKQKQKWFIVPRAKSSFVEINFPVRRSKRRALTEKRTTFSSHSFSFLCNLCFHSLCNFIFFFETKFIHSFGIQKSAHLKALRSESN